MCSEIFVFIAKIFIFFSDSVGDGNFLEKHVRAQENPFSSVDKNKNCCFCLIIKMFLLLFEERQNKRGRNK
jgi:hypothetical protein